MRGQSISWIWPLTNYKKMISFHDRKQFDVSQSKIAVVQKYSKTTSKYKNRNAITLRISTHCEPVYLTYEPYTMAEISNYVQKLWGIFSFEKSSIWQQKYFGTGKKSLIVPFLECQSPIKFNLFAQKYSCLNIHMN